MVPEITKKIMREKRDSGSLASSTLEELENKRKKKKKVYVTRGESSV